MKEGYSHVGPVEVRLMEECAEVIHIVSKALRFGWKDWHPVHKEMNTDRALSEMEDVVRTWNELAEREGLPKLDWMGDE